jgi:hypothetical protein
MQGLGLWVATQKVAYRFDKATMSQSRIDALDAMGFVWQSQKRKDSWSRYFDDLVNYIRVGAVFMASCYYLCTFVQLNNCCLSSNMAPPTSPSMMKTILS